MPGVALAVAQMFAEPLAVVRREYDDSVVRNAEPVEPVENAADVVIDLGYHGVIAVARGAQFIVGKVLWASAGVEGRWEGRQRQRGWIVEIEKLLGSHPRIVRRIEAGDAEKRAVPVARHKLHGLLGDKRRVGQLAATAAGQGAFDKALFWMRDPVADVHDPLPLD